MNKIIFNLQAKGGVGKSFLTYLQKQKYQNEDIKYFDLDQANQTTAKRIKGAFFYDLLNEKNQIEREAFLIFIEEVSANPISIVDMGATESVEFCQMLINNCKIEEIKEALDELNTTIEFNVVIGGADSFNACLKFHDDLKGLVNDCYKITPYINAGKLIPGELENIKGVFEESITYGSTQNELSDNALLEKIKNGEDIIVSKLSLPIRIKYNKLLKELPELKEVSVDNQE